MKQWEHDELAEDLGDTKQTNFLNVHLGSPYLQYSVQRADVMEIKPSYTRFCVSIYEAKISRSDFQSDLRTEKWKGYLEHCHRFYFAVPAGMVDKSEIPPEAGLIIRGETGWSTIKASKAREVEIPGTTLLSLIFSKQRITHSSLHRDRIWYLEGYHQREKLYKTLGKEIGAALRNKDEYQRSKDNFDWESEHIRELIKEGLGEDCSWPDWKLNELVRRIKEKALGVSA